MLRDDRSPAAEGGTPEVTSRAAAGTNGADRPRRRTALLLALLVGWAVAVRTWEASVGLHAGETFDERFTLVNVAAVVTGHGLRPQQAYYPSLSYLPPSLVLLAADAVHRITGWRALDIYKELLDAVKDRSVYLEEFARTQIGQEEMHGIELRKMLRDIGVDH